MAAALLSFCVMSMGSQAGPVFDLTGIERIESYKELPAGAVGAAFATAEGFGWVRLLRATSDSLSFEIAELPKAQPLT